MHRCSERADDGPKGAEARKDAEDTQDPDEPKERDRGQLLHRQGKQRHCAPAFVFVVVRHKSSRQI